MYWILLVCCDLECVSKSRDRISNIAVVFTYLHDLSSKPVKPGIPDKLVWDDGWFETYGYILCALLIVVAVVDWSCRVTTSDDGDFEILPSSEFANEPLSDVVVDVANDKFMPAFCVLLLWWWLLPLLKLLLMLILLLLFKLINDATEVSAELVNGWNCV